MGEEDKQEILQEDGILPLYYQLIGIIKRKIRMGSLKPGDKLPSEKEICSKYKISRTTVRQALLSLVNEGLLYRKQGKGTFVARPKLSRNLVKVYSFSEDMKNLGLIPSSKVLEQRIVPATEDLVENLNLKTCKDRVIKFTRVRLANSEPLLIETTYIPYDLVPSLIEEDLEHNSLYSILNEKYQLFFSHAVETYEAISIGRKEANLLKCKPLSPGFFIERITYLEDGTPIEVTNSITRADRCKFVAILGENHTSIKRKVFHIKNHYQKQNEGR